MCSCLMTKSSPGMTAGGRRGRQRRKRQRQSIRDLVKSELITDKRIGTIIKQIVSEVQY